MLDFEHYFIAQICGRSLQPEDVKAVLDIVKPYLTDEQIFQINKDVQEYFDAKNEAELNSFESQAYEG